MTAAGRKPVDAAADNRQQVWDALRLQEGAWVGLTDVAALAQVNLRTAGSYVDCLIAGGYLERRLDPEPGGGARTRLMLRVIKDAGHHAPRLRKDGSAVTQGGGVANLWRSMRMLGKFSALELSLHSTTPTVTVTLETAKSYCSMLLSTGYLRVLQKAEPVKGRLAIYRLIRNDGPKAPKIQRVKQVYDPNTGHVYRREGQK